MESLLDLIKELTGLYREFIEVEKEKRQVLFALNPEKLEEITLKEQPLLLRARGLDSKRKDVCKALGFENKNLEDVVLHLKFADLKEEHAVCKAHSELAEIMFEFKKIIEENGDMVMDYGACLKKNLDEIEEALGNGGSVDLTL